MKLAVIGAGIAGLSFARTAKQNGHDVTLFDKGRGPGGRLSTRRMLSPLGELRFDHGAMGFKPRTKDFANQCKNWVANGWIAPWQPRTATLTAAGFTDIEEQTFYTGATAMNDLIKGLLQDQAVLFGVRIHQIARYGQGWRLTFEDDTPDFICDGVVCATPAEQAKILLSDAAPDLAGLAAKAVSSPCWSVMMAFTHPVDLEFDLIFGAKAPFLRLIRNTAKPGRAETECWVIQTAPDWTKDRLDWPADDIAAEITTGFAALTNGNAAPVIASAHRWLYAQISNPAPPAIPWDGAHNIGVCGDWLKGSDIEAAWASGQELAGLVS